MATTKYVTLNIQVSCNEDMCNHSVEVAVPIVRRFDRERDDPIRDSEIEEACSKLGNALDKILEYDFHDHNNNYY